VVLSVIPLFDTVARGSQWMAMPSGNVDDDPIGLQPTTVVDLALDSYERIDVQFRHVRG
jgi:hypothetical protein